MKDSLYTTFFSAVLGSICALLLAGVGQYTAPYRAANAEAEEKRNILEVLEVPFDREASPQELLKRYETNVRKEERGNLVLYQYVDPAGGGKVKAVAIPFKGPGLWGPIEGFLAMEPDFKTIRGVAFHHQEETPGLGGEIGAPWFRNQFKGKSIEDGSGKPGIRIRRPGGELASHEVDGITAATITCDKVQTMLNKTIERIVEERGKHVY